MTSTHEPLATDWTRLAERGTGHALRAGVWVYRRLGSRICRLLLLPTALYFYLKERAWRGASRRHLDAVWAHAEGGGGLGRRPGPLAPLRHYHEFGVQVFDRMLLWGGGLDQFEMEHAGSEHLFALARERRGALLLGSHLGSFDMARTLATRYGLVLNAVMYTDNGERINRLFEELDPTSRVRVLAFDPTSVRTAFEIRACLARGEMVGILADRLPEGSREEPFWIDFLGRPVAWPRSPFLLACLLGCPVLVSVCVREGTTRYRTTVEPIGAGRRLPRREREKAAEELARAYVRHLERVCLRYPHQWFNFYDVPGVRAA
jgi:predicted LPLAT superfamily acyltransferase